MIPYVVIICFSFFHGSKNRFPQFGYMQIIESGDWVLNRKFQKLVLKPENAHTVSFTPGQAGGWIDTAVTPILQAKQKT